LQRVKDRRRSRQRAGTLLARSCLPGFGLLLRARRLCARRFHSAAAPRAFAHFLAGFLPGAIRTRILRTRRGPRAARARLIELFFSGQSRALPSARFAWRNKMRFTAIFAALCLSLSILGTAQAHDYTAGSIHIAHPWSREIPKGASVAGGYFTIENKGTAPDRLIGGSAEIAGRFQIHQMKTEG